MEEEAENITNEITKIHESMHAIRQNIKKVAYCKGWSALTFFGATTVEQ